MSVRPLQMRQLLRLLLVFVIERDAVVEAAVSEASPFEDESDCVCTPSEPASQIDAYDPSTGHTRKQAAVFGFRQPLCEVKASRPVRLEAQLYESRRRSHISGVTEEVYRKLQKVPDLQSKKQTPRKGCVRRRNRCKLEVPLLVEPEWLPSRYTHRQDQGHTKKDKAMSTIVSTHARSLWV